MAASAPDTAAEGYDINVALGACARAERIALNEIYAREAAQMLGVARRMLRRQALAEEAVHDTFVLIWRQAGGFDPARGTGRTWIYAILRNRCLNILRGEKRTDLIADYEPFNLVSEDEGPEDALLRLCENSRLRACLDRLDPARRTVIVLAYANGLTHGELAGRFAVPLGTMKSWIRRSLLVLKECLA
ncbi:MAG: sigma-70 family RNA polymerase sigma factor [Pseudomonadota bacterium]